MKQHITVEQLNELSEKGKEKLGKWWKPIVGDWFDDDGYMRIIPDDETKGAFVLNSFHTPLLSIGQMIKFLDEHRSKDMKYYWGVAHVETPSENVWYVGDDGQDELSRTKHESKDLCNVLWGAMKEVLEKS